MKILFHINSLGHGGAERVVSVLANEFAKAGHQVIIATQWRAENEYPILEEIKKVVLDECYPAKRTGRISKILQRYKGVRRCIIENAPDVVISFCNKANFRCSVAMTGMSVPLVVSVRNDPERDYAPYKLSTAIMEKRATGCVFQTPDARDFFNETLKNKSRIIINPLSEKYLSAEVDYSAKALLEDRVIVSMGRICSQKNQLLLVEAFANIADEYPDVKVKIFGGIQDEEYAASLVNLIKDKGLTDRVLLCGDSDNTVEELKKAYMFVLSSDYEGMPNALMEALAMGVPSISTDCPCGGSKLLLEKTGFLVPVNDSQKMAQAMKQLLENPELADRFSHDGLEIRNQASPKVVAQRWMDFINRIIG